MKYFYNLDDFFSGILPKFVEWESLTNFGINVSKTYKSLVKSNDLKSDERSDKYFQRSFKLMSHLLKETTGIDFLFTT